ncbi:hypothetical protein Tco_1330142, partial [Tanacetum coccineum]
MKKTLDQSQNLKGIEMLSDVAQLATDTQKAIKASKRAYRIHQKSRGLSEGAGITPEVPDEPKCKSVAQDDDWGFDEEEVILSSDVERTESEREHDDANEETNDVENADKDDERKFEAWTKVDHSEAIEESVQVNIINKVKNQLPKFLPKAISDFVNLRIKSIVCDVLQKNPAFIAQSSFTLTQPTSRAVDSLSDYELKKILLD